MDEIRFDNNAIEVQKKNVNFNNDYINNAHGNNENCIEDKENEVVEENDYLNPDRERNLEEDIGIKGKKRKRQQNRLSDSNCWEYNANKKKREEGKMYKGRLGNQFLVERNKRVMKKRCTCQNKLFKTTNPLKCFQINEEVRKKILNKFWSYSWEEKKCMLKDVQSHQMLREREIE
nr:uncharacterized protein LOC111419659 [Onthophagus taurus]